MTRYADAPTQLPASSLDQSIKAAALRVGAADFSLRCAGVAFYGLVSLFPAIGLSVTLYGLVTDASALQGQLETARPFLPGDVYSVIEERLNDIVRSSNAALGVGLLASLAMVLWSSSRGTNSLIGVLGAAYSEPDERSFVHSAAISVAITLGAIAFAAVAIFVVAAIPLLIRLLPLGENTELAVRIASWPAMACFAITGIAILYRLAPHRRDARWKWILPGAAAAAILWLAGTALFSVYVENFGNYDATFGSIATIIVLMLWMYYSALIVAFGAALNGQLEFSTRRDSTVGPHRPMGERGAYVADHIRS